MMEQPQQTPKISHTKSHTLEEEPQITPTVTWFGAFLLGIAMKLGGCTVGWSKGFSVGFENFSIAVVVIGLAYLLLGLCMAEMISIMSFSGGYYGYARCAIGPFPGYIVGCCGILESTFSMSVSILKIGQFVTLAFDTSDNLEPVWWFLTYTFVISCHYFGGKWFWYWIAGVAIVGLSFVLMYLFGTMSDLDFEKYAYQKSINNNPTDLLSIFRLSTLFFLGFDMLTMTSSEVINPKVGVPRAMISLISFLLIFAIWLMFTVSSQAPGISKTLMQPTSIFPLLYGYERLFALEKRYALCLCVIPSFATPLGYMYVVGKQVQSMAKSGLLPSLLKQTFGDGIPLYGMGFVICLSLCGLFYSWSVNPYTILSLFSTLGCCFVYLAMFICYIIFQTRFSNLERSFRNPLGMVSAIVGMIIFAAILILVIFINTDNYQVTVLFFGYLFLMTIYYYMYAETHQFFSAAEQKVFFKAYIVNMKQRKKQSVWYRMLSDVLHMIGWKLSRAKVYATSHSGLNSGGSQSNLSDESHSKINSNHHQDASVSQPHHLIATIGSGFDEKNKKEGMISRLLISPIRNSITGNAGINNATAIATAMMGDNDHNHYEDKEHDDNKITQHEVDIEAPPQIVAVTHEEEEHENEHEHEHEEDATNINPLPNNNNAITSAAIMSC